MIIVTGGAGLIGSGIVAALNSRGRSDIFIVDHLGESSKWKNLIGLDFADYTEKGDFLEMVINDQVSFPVEAIFHMGACSSTTQSDCSYLISNNYQYSKTVANWALKNDARFIYASSAATYGDGSRGFSDDQSKLNQLQPLNMYGYSKQMFDLWASRNHLLDKIVGLKYFNVFGPNEYHKGSMRSFVIKAFEQITADGAVKLFKSDNPEYSHGNQVRDFIYIKDAVEMTLFFYDNPAANGIFNIGTGQARCWNDLVEAVFKAMKLKTNITYIDMPANLKGKYQYYTQADISKIKAAGYNCDTITLEDAVGDYVQQYLYPDGHLTAKSFTAD